MAEAQVVMIITLVAVIAGAFYMLGKRVTQKTVMCSQETQYDLGDVCQDPAVCQLLDNEYKLSLIHI